MKYSFHPEAEAEFVQAIDYYEECGAGLGYDFAVEVYSAIERIMAHPKAWPILEEDMRRSLVRRFPLGLYTRPLMKSYSLWRSCTCTGILTIGSRGFNKQGYSSDGGTPYRLW